MINLNQLRSFHKVAEYGSFTVAAQALRVTQPALTNQIKGLEGHYGVELFYRKARSIELTPTGRDLFEVTERLFGMVEQAEGILTQSAGGLSGVLRVGAESPYQLVELLQQFQVQYPSIRLEVSFGNASAIATGLKKFQTDIAFLSQLGKAPDFHSIHWLGDVLVAFVNRAHPWAKAKSVGLKRFHGAQSIRREAGSNTQFTFDQACKEAGVVPDYVVQMGSREALKEAVVAGMGVGIIPKSELGCDDRVVPIAIRGSSLVSDGYIASLKTRKNAPLIGAFFDFLESGGP